MSSCRKVFGLALAACLLSFVFAADSAAQGSQQAEGSGGTAQAVERRPPDNPLESRSVLNEVTWSNGALIPYGAPKSWFDFKDEIHEKIGLQFGVSYQMLLQQASETVPDSEFDSAVGDWWGFMLRWAMVDRDGDYEGNLVFSMFDRGTVGNNANPALFGSGNLGSLWTTIEFTSWSLAIENLYWEQWVGKRRFMFRVGNQIATTVINPFRFKDVRTSFSASPFAFHESIPYPTFGFGVSAKYWPIEDSELYVAATVNDMNGDPNLQGFDWSTVSRGEFFYGVEIGHNWKRSEDDFDHVHLDLFYASKRSTRSPDDIPNEPGGGFKFLGSKQIGQWVGFGSYTLNTAEGGGVGASLAKHTVTAGIAYQKPFDLPGEASLGFMLMDPNRSIFGDADLRAQYGTEMYWRMLLNPHIWITPGVQLLFNPTLNPDVGFSAIPHLKFRIVV